MNEISKDYKNLRVFVLVIVLIIGIVAAGIYGKMYEDRNIVKSSFSVCLDAETENVFEKQFDNKKDFNKSCNNSYFHSIFSFLHKAKHLYPRYIYRSNRDAKKHSGSTFYDCCGLKVAGAQFKECFSG